MDAEEVLSRAPVHVYLGKIMVVGTPFTIYVGYSLNRVPATVARAEAYPPGGNFPLSHMPDAGADSGTISRRRWSHTWLFRRTGGLHREDGQV